MARTAYAPSLFRGLSMKCPQCGIELNHENDKLTKSTEDVGYLLEQTWDEAFKPVKQKYPNIDVELLILEFLKKIKTGEVEDSAGGLMKTAEDLKHLRV